MSNNFRTCLIGGFDKNDVVKFIKKNAEENQARIAALEEEKAALQEKIKCLSSSTESMGEQLRNYEDGGETLSSLHHQVEQLRCRAEKAEQEAEELRGPAAEYQQMKNHIAEIEINAHKRTEEFRACAMERLRAIIAQQRQWCGEQRELYDAMNNEKLAYLREEQRRVEEADYSAFDKMQKILNEMEDELHD